MPDQIHLIPTAEIDAAALPRDRSSLDEAELTELRLSIAANGLRMPVEVYAFKDDAAPADPDTTATPEKYGLISGFRRLAAFRALHDLTSDAKYTTIPAFIREPKSATEALTAMVEENAIRADISPWEQAAVAVHAHDGEFFETIEAAIQTLYASFSADKRRRLRAVATVIETLEDLLISPERLSLRRLLRIAAALTRNYGALIRHALETATVENPDEQWQRLLPVLVESEATEPVEPAPAGGGPRRPRRTYDPARYNLRIRREMTGDGWALHFTGRDAKSWLLDIVFDNIEALFSPGNPMPKTSPRPDRPAIDPHA